MNYKEDLSRFLDAQKSDYSAALNEIQEGRKRSHWMWYIFPQMAGLGRTETSRHYAIKSLNEATQYLAHPVLGERLVEITEALLSLSTHDAHAIFGSPDDMKLKSSMTLFSLVPAAPPIFDQVIDTYFEGEKDEKTLRLLNLTGA